VSPSKPITGLLAWNVACRNVRTTSAKKALLSTLVFNVNPRTGSFFKSLGDLILESGCSEGFIKTTLKHWRSIGLVDWKQGNRRNGEANTYTLSLPELQKQADKSTTATKDKKDNSRQKARDRFNRWYQKHKGQRLPEAIDSNGTESVRSTALSNASTASYGVYQRSPETCHENLGMNPIYETSCAAKPSCSNPLFCETLQTHESASECCAATIDRTQPEPELTARQTLEQELARARKTLAGWKRNDKPDFQQYLTKSQQRVADLELQLVEMESYSPVAMTAETGSHVQ